MEDDLHSGRKLDSVLVEWEIEGKGMFKWETWGKGCMSSSGLKRHQGMKHKKYQSIARKIFKVNSKWVFQLDEKSGLICQQDLCLTEDIRKKFGSCDFIDDDALELWKYLESVVEVFHGVAEKYNMNFYGLLHKNLLKFEGDIAVTTILLPEIGNHLLIHYAKSGGGTAIPYWEMKIYLSRRSSGHHGSIFYFQIF